MLHPEHPKSHVVPANSVQKAGEVAVWHQGERTAQAAMVDTGPNQKEFVPPVQNQ